MKLKIDYIQDIIHKQCDNFDSEKLVVKNGDKYSAINYPDEAKYIATKMLEDILKDYAGAKGLHFNDVYLYKDYAAFNGCGFYLGKPYRNLSNLFEIVRNKITILRYFSELSGRVSLKDEVSTILNKHESLELFFLQHMHSLDKARKMKDNLLGELDIQQEYYSNFITEFNSHIKSKIEEVKNINTKYINQTKYEIETFFTFILKDSFYWFDFDCAPLLEYSVKDRSIIIEYHLPNLTEIPDIKEIKNYKTKPSEIKYLSERELIKIYDDFIYAITIRSIAEVFHFDSERVVDTVLFNGRVISRNSATGQLEDNCILSVQVKRDEFEKIDLNYIDAKACFKHFKGVGAAKLSSLSAVVPIMETSRYDKRFRDSKEVAVDTSTNLAAMHWEDFEHLIRELFEKEFSVNGGEVKVTQASRDGGVDAIAFDPDPIRGGKIVIQAKRYTNTVGVSAVRDLYGTVINEGANKGILITSSDYGSDSYSFAKGKPLTLLNGGHLLYLLEKHGEKARIDIEEAKSLSKLN